jgi:hypothetical protein
MLMALRDSVAYNNDRSISTCRQLGNIQVLHRPKELKGDSALAWWLLLLGGIGGEFDVGAQSSSPIKQC